MMRLAVLPILLGMGLVQPAQALDFQPTQSITLNWTEPGVFQFDRFTIPVGVTVSLPVVEAGLAAPRAYFTIAGDVLLEGSLLAPGWDVSMDFNGSFQHARISYRKSFAHAEKSWHREFAIGRRHADRWIIDQSQWKRYHC